MRERYQFAWYCRSRVWARSHFVLFYLIVEILMGKWKRGVLETCQF